MDIVRFTEILKDKHCYELKKLKYKYSVDFDEFLGNLKALYYYVLPLSDLRGEKIVYTPNFSEITSKNLRLLLKDQTRSFAIKSAEQEIVSTCAIENIDISRESVRNILRGFAPVNEQENRILGLKKGFEFISDKKNTITEENLFALYNMTVGDFLSEENRLKDGCFYRDDSVFVVSDKIEHEGLDCKKIPEYMNSLIEFINADDSINDLVKAAVIHFYIAMVHPYFDGNGRIARLVHLWFLIQKGYQSALFIPFSSEIEKSRKKYYEAFTLINENKELSRVTDVTPIISYFINNVYNKVHTGGVGEEVMSAYKEMLGAGNVTEKENELWQFVLSFYGTDSFSTKQLEKDFGGAAYATIRGFVLKFEKFGLLTSEKYSNRVKYRCLK